MKFFDIEPVIDKIRKSISYSDKTLFIFTDSNPDNLSYIKGIKKVNEKEMFVKSVISIDVNDSKDRDLFKNRFSLTDYIYIMTSVFDNDFVREAIELWPTSCYSEIINDCRKIYPTPNAIVDTILHYYNNDLRTIVITVANRSQVIGKPLVNKLIDLNATINWVHTKSSEFYKNECFINADCIVTAAGIPNSFNIVGYNKDQLIIDAGINVVDGKVCGDWNLDQLKTFDNITITKNPGGIGKLTTYELFKEICNG